MGFVVISETNLSVQEVFAALGKNNRLEEACESIPLVYLRRRNGIQNTTGFYFQCVRQNPYEYLVMTIAELDQMLKVSEDYDAPLDELCRLLARRNEGEEDEDDEQDEDEAEAAGGNAAQARHENGAENGEVDAVANHDAVQVNEPEDRNRNAQLEIIDDIEIEVVFENEVQLVENEVDGLDEVN